MGVGGVLPAGRLPGGERGARRGAGGRGGRHRGLASQLWRVSDFTPSGVEGVYVVKVIRVPFVGASGRIGASSSAAGGVSSWVTAGEAGATALSSGPAQEVSSGSGGGVSTRGFLVLRRVPPGLGGGGGGLRFVLGLERAAGARLELPLGLRGGGAGDGHGLRALGVGVLPEQRLLLQGAGAAFLGPAERPPGRCRCPR